MFTRTTAVNAAAQSWDVIIAGSSFSAMFFLRGLPANTRVLIVEKGEVIPHEQQLSEPELPSETYALDNQSDHEKDWVAHRLFGGNSNCWWGQVPRFHPNDFRLAEQHGIGAPWPIGYDDLEPFYTQVEAIMEIAGGGTEHIFPRSKPYPFGAHVMSRSDQACADAFPDIWLPVPTARSNGGNRTICCTNGVCHRCPVDAKFTIQNGIHEFSRDGVSLLTGAEAREVVIAAGAAKGLLVRTDAGEDVVLSAGVVALGTNAISNAAILLRSGLKSPALGRYLHEQHSVDLFIDVAAKGYFGGTSITGHCYGFYDGVHRKDAAAVLIENYNAPNSIRFEKGRWTDRMKLKLIAEDLPQAENRVELDAAGAAKVTWMGHSDYAKAGLARAEAGLADVLPFAIEGVFERKITVTEAHIQGTHRMGTDAQNSVVDKTSRTHEADEVFALGAGVFPTSSAANPTLTLSALALMAGRSV